MLEFACLHDNCTTSTIGKRFLRSKDRLLWTQSKQRAYKKGRCTSFHRFGSFQGFGGRFAVGLGFGNRRFGCRHFCHGVGPLFLFGGELVDFYRQYMARGTGPTKGREANVHWFDFTKGFVGPA